MNKFFTAVILVVVSFLCFSCTKDNDIVISVKTPVTDAWDSIEENSPVLANAENAFALVVVGNEYSKTFDEKISFTDSSTSITIYIEDYETGNCSIQIKKDSETILFEREISSNFTYAIVSELENIPEQIVIVLDDFSGKLNFVLAESGSETE